MTTDPTPIDASDTRFAKRLIALLSLAVIAAVSVLMLVPSGAGDQLGPSALVTINACLNASAASALLAGFVSIRRGNRQLHRALMLGAFGLSTLFLVLYVVHHSQVGSLPFRGQGWQRPVYFALLVPHVILAAGMLPLALLTIYRAWTGRFVAHRKVARWTFPIWLFVSVSGVLIYWMQYHL